MSNKAVISGPGGSGATGGGLRPWLRASRTVAAAVLVVGTGSAVIAAASVASRDADKSHRTFAAASTDIASTLQLAIQHEEDLVVNAGALITGRPTITNAEFAMWSATTTVFARYPELEGFGYSRIVPAAELATFALHAVADPTGSLAPDGSFQVVPPGSRPFYCLIVVGQARSATLELPAGFDLCAAARPGMLSARDSGKSDYKPITAQGVVSLSISTPIYRGVAPSTVSERQEKFLGWLGMSVDPAVVLNRALTGHPDTAVVFRYQAGSSDVTFRSGTVPRQATSQLIDLQNGWTVSTYGAVAARDMFANAVALEVLIAGIAVSLLLAMLIYVLATGRARALGLVTEKTRELQHQALHDVLTGLPNRALIMDRIERMLARNRRNATTGAALFIDLDGFKNVNDTLGHAAGDRLLQAVGARICATLRDADTVGRMGGDEFVILIDGGALEDSAELVAARLLEAMRQPFDLDFAPMPIVVTTSIGVAVGDRDAPGDLLRDADVALYQAKAAGRNCYAVFHHEMAADVQHRYELEFDLRAALEGHQFHLVYQPIYNLDDLTVVGVEALIRWQHPTLGEIQPNDFIPLLESSGQIVEVGRWVLGEACAQMARWRDRGSGLIVSVNVSSRQLDRDVIVEHVQEALDDSGLDPAALTLEVTERVMMRDIDTAVRRLAELKQLGVKIAIDDFGTGYASLAYLQRMPVDCLKIDRVFTEAMTRSAEAAALIHTLVQLGKDLGMTTLAEGVENTAQFDELRREGVTEVQGFLLARPLGRDAIEALLFSVDKPDVSWRPVGAGPAR